MAKTVSELETEIEVLNEALTEADELTASYVEQIKYLSERNRLLENRLNIYGIGFDDIDCFLDAE